jgi:hypothetical protein
LCLDELPREVTYPPRQRPAPLPILTADGALAQKRQDIAGDTEKMWNIGQTVRVRFLEGSADWHSRIREYASEWSQSANLTFAFVGRDERAEIKISFDAGGSYSAVGRDALAYPFDFSTMNFDWRNNPSEQRMRQEVLHEFGHALGLIHEHQTPAAPDFQWNKPVVYADLAKSGWTKQRVDENVFKKYGGKRITNYSEFDPDSIMGYYIPPEWTLDNYTVPDNPVLSKTDKTYIKRWYPNGLSPENSSGLLRTGDDCDEIEFEARYTKGIVEPGSVGFRLAPGPGITWWKMIEVPYDSGYYQFQMQDGHTASADLPSHRIDRSRPIRFWKAKEFGVHRRLENFTWDALPALPMGSMLTLRWRRDHC